MFKRLLLYRFNYMASMKKYIVLSILFILPITAYIFFALSTNYFRPLPVLKEHVQELDGFQNLKGEHVQLKGKITILGFFGEDLEAHRAYAYNLAHKIYGKNHKFKDFQFVVLLPKGTEQVAQSINDNIEQVAPTDAWHFVFGSKEQIRAVFDSLGTTYPLDEGLSTPYVYIIDKDLNQRGRDDDKDFKDGFMYGYNSALVAEINNKMNDDVKVLLAEYRRALKKYNSQREI